MPQILVGELILTFVIVHAMLSALKAGLLTLLDFRERQRIGILVLMITSSQPSTISEDQRNILLLGSLSGPSRALEQARIDSFRDKPGHTRWLHRVRKTREHLSELGPTARQLAKKRVAEMPKEDWPARDAVHPPSNAERLARGETLETVLREYPVSKLVPEGHERAQSPLPSWQPLNPRRRHRKQSPLTRNKRLFPNLAAWMRRRKGSMETQGATTEIVDDDSDADSVIAEEA